ncbi:hypothetical protein GCM10007859_26220 [Brevundimonas denitrificans]|uniref:HTH cro/C1-type domain-containing protein n=1 Tax=Brevundimonas denitrificans TaxID=1443434 RepID=A0ABQ6BKM6_9CAUL|nr:helix-turn-helix domain-containing protein [Brevundimonas denitrificans]GLS02595.1 hypothetical protein GCM10007859_26220 [Brevundimonas denitrificans]
MAKEKDEVADELRALKMLMILQLLRQGVKQSQIAAVLGVSEATMSRMLPTGITKAVSKGTAAETGG